MLRSIQRCLWVIGFIVLGYCGMAWISASRYQTLGNAELDHLINSNAPNVAQSPLIHGGLVGKMEISRLGLTAVIFEGTDEPVLSQGVGHLTGSAMPGQNGNVVLAGHRDSFFRALRNIRSGDVVEVTTAQGVRTYSIAATRIVKPTEVSVMAPTSTPTLTLITCYPFYFVGNAPSRFIVRGTEIPVSSSL